MLILLFAILLGIKCDAADNSDQGKDDLSYYELLQVDATIEPKALKKHYRKLALKNHPDKVSNPAERVVAEKLFMEYANAYEILSNTVTRTRYDYLLTQGILKYENRDWSEFDFRNGLDKKDAKYVKRAKFFETFSDARRRFDEMGKEPSDLSLFISLLGALGVGFIPIAMHWQRKAKKKSGKNETLKAAAKQQAELNRELEAYRNDLLQEQLGSDEDENDDDDSEGEEEEEEEEEEEGTPVFEGIMPAFTRRRCSESYALFRTLCQVFFTSVR